MLTVRCSGSKIYKTLKVVISGILEEGILKGGYGKQELNVLKVTKEKKVTGLKRIYLNCSTPTCNCIVNSCEARRW